MIKSLQNNDIKTLSELLTNEDCKVFITNLKQRFGKKSDKYIAVFNDKPSSSITKNHFRVLKKRLKDYLIDFLVKKEIQDESTAYFYGELEVIKKVLLLENFALANKLIDELEKKAQSRNYALLSDIYALKIEYAHLLKIKDLDLLIKQFETHRKQADYQYRLNIACTLAKREFELIQRKGSLTKEVDYTSVKAIFDRFKLLEHGNFNYKILSQFATVLDISGTINRNYTKIELFFEQEINQLIQPENKIENAHYAFNLFYLLGYIYFRKKKFEQSLSYLNKAKNTLTTLPLIARQESEADLKILMASVFNYKGNYIQALNLLTSIEKTPSKEHFLKKALIKGVIHFQQEDFDQARKEITSINRYKAKTLQSLGLEWELQAQIIHLLLQIELGNIDSVDRSFHQISKKIKAYAHGANSRVFDFLEMVKSYYLNSEITHDSAFKNKLYALSADIPVMDEDLIFISFYAWLKSKVEQTPLYTTTLSLINSTVSST